MSKRRPGSREILPLFPLGTVLVPGLVLPLHVFEPRYRRLLRDLADRAPGDRLFGVVAIRHGHEVGANAVTELHDVGTAALLREVEWLPDGRARTVSTGTSRFRLLRPVDGAPYRRAEVEWLPEPDGEGSQALVPVVAAAFVRYRSAVGLVGTSQLPREPSVLSYSVAAAMVLELRERQPLLAAADCATRLRAELALLRREIGLMALLPSLPALELPEAAAGPN